MHGFAVDPGAAEEAWTDVFLLADNFAARNTVVDEIVLLGLAVADLAAGNEVLADVAFDSDLALGSAAPMRLPELIVFLFNLLDFLLVGVDGTDLLDELLHELARLLFREVHQP